MKTAPSIAASGKRLFGLLLSCVGCMGLSGCMLLAAGAAGAAGGCIAGRAADDDPPREVHIHENRPNPDDRPTTYDVD